jgi:gluconolactonase
MTEAMPAGTRTRVDMATPRLDAIVDAEAPLDQIAHGLKFGEGPLWDARQGRLLWVDIIGDTIWQWRPGVGSAVLIRPSRHANGLTLDREGRVVVAGWSARTIWRIEPDGSFVTLAAHYQGKKFNSPNDVVVRSDGTIYWTDTFGGLVIPGMTGDDLQRYLDVQGVFCLRPGEREVRLVIDDCVYPNGLAFAPDESILYVNDTRQAHIRAFDVRADGSVGAGRLFHKLTGSEPGVADGLKVDRAGHVYCTGPGGIHVLDAGGALLGRLRIPGHTTNMGWGEPDWRTLFITTYTSVFRLRMRATGIAVGPGSDA